MTSRCGIVLKPDDRGSPCPWLGWDFAEAALEKELSSFADMEPEQFGGSHLEISGVVVEVGGSDPCLRFMPAVRGLLPGASGRSPPPARATISGLALFLEPGFHCWSFGRALGHWFLRVPDSLGTGRCPCHFSFSMAAPGGLEGVWMLGRRGEGRPGRCTSVQGSGLALTPYVSVFLFH